MALPKIDSPIFHVTVPVVDVKLTLRPYKMKEEKILLLAQQSNDPSAMVLAMKQVINNCIVEGTLDIDNTPSFVIEYILLHLRKQSVGSTSTLTFEDNEDGQEYEFKVDLDTISLTEVEGHTDSIELSEGVGILLKYPTLDVSARVASEQDEIEQSLNVIKESIDKVFTDDEVIDFASHTDEEKTEFIDQFTQAQMEQVINFFNTMPSIKHTIEYTNSNGNERKIELTGVSDFFT